MKQCSYCGAKYPGDATECAIDKTPFEEVRPEPVRFKRPTFAIFSEHKIPVSLAVVSYIWFLPGACGFALVAFAILMFIVAGSFFADGEIILWCFIALGVGIFFLCLSRGLRRCSPGWRTCTLVFIWFGLLASAFDIGDDLLTQKMPAHEAATVFWLSYALGFAWQLWQYRVLTRPDVRDLFGG